VVTYKIYVSIIVVAISKQPVTRIPYRHLYRKETVYGDYQILCQMSDIIDIIDIIVMGLELLRWVGGIFCFNGYKFISYKK